ncbi:MAG TPA: lactate utilization protein [Syntrophorhabdaceae bacterium]|nr:lactate utilization protein [Syntrophorhabdaceae bacterium]
MLQESDLSREENLFNKTRATLVIKSLGRRNIEGYYVSDRTEALSAVMEMIPPGVVVGRADSVTLFDLGIMPALIERNQNKLIDPFEKDEKGLLPEVDRRRQLQREALLSDIFLTGTSAITLDGRLVNIDGTGNRVAAMTFGPKKVVVVAGTNKIVRNVEEGLQRIHGICTPMNIIRHRLKHGTEVPDEPPCVKTGKCADCYHEWRICRYTMIIEGQMPPDRNRIKVVLVGEPMGI